CARTYYSNGDYFDYW
nr:immunoglobulin heavy chain junction region [Mus musculus]